jgi:hypothetical protein
MPSPTRSAPPNPRPAERIWSMQKSGRRIDAELQAYGDARCACRIFDEDDWCLFRCAWPSRAQALADAEDQRQALARNGWTTDG